MKGISAFDHDSDARKDPKLKAIEEKYILGYSWYFKAVEYLSENGGRLEKSNMFFASILSTEIGCPPDILLRFLKDCIQEGLFYIERANNGNEFLRSRRLDSEVEARERESKLMRFIAESKAKKQFEEDSFEYKTAIRFFELFAKPSGAKMPNVHSWANVFRMMKELDGRSESYIIDTMEAIFGHEGANNFSWREVIRSPETFRKRMNEGKISPDLRTSQVSTGIKASSDKYSDI